MEEPVGSILEKINTPSDLRLLKEEELTSLCDELRQFIIDEVSNNPGHLGASLGVVELTVALHYVYNTPYDQLIWDVGHQAYGHKILTWHGPGRNRQKRKRPEDCSRYWRWLYDRRNGL